MKECALLAAAKVRAKAAWKHDRGNTHFALSHCAGCRATAKASGDKEKPTIVLSGRPDCVRARPTRFVLRK